MHTRVVGLDQYLEEQDRAMQPASQGVYSIAFAGVLSMTYRVSEYQPSQEG